MRENEGGKGTRGDVERIYLFWWKGFGSLLSDCLCSLEESLSLYLPLHRKNKITSERTNFSLSNQPCISKSNADLLVNFRMWIKRLKRV